jgi:hypothetical protein
MFTYIDVQHLIVVCVYIYVYWCPASYWTYKTKTQHRNLIRSATWRIQGHWQHWTYKRCPASYCVLCVCLRILMSSILLWFVCIFTYIDVQHLIVFCVYVYVYTKTTIRCWTSIYVNIHTKHNKMVDIKIRKHTHKTQ